MCTDAAASLQYPCLVPLPNLQNVNNTQALQCTTTLEIPEDMDGPIYVYYELQGFYQNHRRCDKQGVLQPSRGWVAEAGLLSRAWSGLKSMVRSHEHGHGQVLRGSVEVLLPFPDVVPEGQ